MACIVMAYIAMVHIVMAYIAIAYVQLWPTDGLGPIIREVYAYMVMAYIVMAYNGPHSYGLYRPKGACTSI